MDGRHYRRAVCQFDGDDDTYRLSVHCISPKSSATDRRTIEQAETINL